MYMVHKKRRGENKTTQSSLCFLGSKQVHALEFSVSSLLSFFSTFASMINPLASNQLPQLFASVILTKTYTNWFPGSLVHRETDKEFDVGLNFLNVFLPFVQSAILVACAVDEQWWHRMIYS